MSKELLELAAKAVNLQHKGWREGNEPYSSGPGLALLGGRIWNPELSSSDALELAAELRLSIEINEASVVVRWLQEDCGDMQVFEYPESVQNEDYDIIHVNHEKAVRKAVTRAAADIARQNNHTSNHEGPKMFTAYILSRAEKTWTTQAGYPAAVVVQPMGHRCGYVQLPPGHKAGELDYNDLDIAVHGGVTYGTYSPEGTIFGFDCGHFTDSPDLNLMDERYKESYLQFPAKCGTIRSLEYCIAECETMASQFKSLE